jgi:hypothetical protein
MLVWLMASHCLKCRIPASLAQVLVMVLILTGGAFFIRYWVTTMERADFSTMVFMEDSKAGVTRQEAFCDPTWHIMCLIQTI